MAIDWDVGYRSGLFVMVWDLRGYVSGLLVYLLGLSGYLVGRHLIKWDAAWLSGMTEAMSWEAVKLFW